MERNFMPAVKPQYFTVTEAADLLDFSTNSIYKFLKEGRLKGIRGSKIQGRYRISRTSVESFLGQPLTDQYISLKLYQQNHQRHLPEPPQVTFPPVLTQSVTPRALTFIRSLIVVSLIAVIGDMIITGNFSLMQQIIRLSIIALIIAFTYQFGDAAPTEPERS
jgi:excisionase family DNA binding protein